MTTTPPFAPAARRRATARRRTALALAATLLAATAVGTLAAPGPAGAAATTFPVTGRVSVAASGAQLASGMDDEATVAVSDDGRYVAFSTAAPAVPGDTNGAEDAYLRDRLGGTTIRASLNDADQQLVGGASRMCAISGDGRFVAFHSTATNLPAGGTGQIYVRDRLARTTRIATVSTAEVPSATGGVGGIPDDDVCALSDDGRYLAFTGYADNLVADDDNGHSDIFRRDLQATTTVRLSVSTAGAEAVDGFSSAPAMSDDGQVVTFASEAENLVPGDTNGLYDVFVRAGGVTTRVSVSANGSQLLTGGAYDSAVSGDGKVIAFATASNSVVAGDDNGASDVFVRTLATGTVERASVSPSGAEGDDGSYVPSLSQDGRYVGFSSHAGNFYPADPEDHSLDAFRRDRTAGRTDLVSRAAGSILPGDGAAGANGVPLSDDGRVAAFVSNAANLVRGDTNGGRDAFVRDFGVDTVPFPSFDAHVKQQFADFVGRAPTAGELVEWRTRLTHGEVSPDGVIDTLAHSTAFAGRRAPVARLYWAFFERAPDTPGLAHWVAQLQAGRSLAWIATTFTATAEFKATFGPSISSTAFVTLVYQNVLDRDPDAAGLAYWTQQLDQGLRSRGTVMTGFSESAEGKAHLAPPVDAVLVWLGMLGTVPTPSQLATVLADLAGQPVEALARLIRGSSAYAARL